MITIRLYDIVLPIQFAEEFQKIFPGTFPGKSHAEWVDMQVKEEHWTEPRIGQFKTLVLKGYLRSFVLVEPREDGDHDVSAWGTKNVCVWSDEQGYSIFQRGEAAFELRVREGAMVIPVYIDRTFSTKEAAIAQVKWVVALHKYHELWVLEMDAFRRDGYGYLVEILEGKYDILAVSEEWNRFYQSGKARSEEEIWWVNLLTIVKKEIGLEESACQMCHNEDAC